jgi:Flp pilus assembly protein TadB
MHIRAGMSMEAAIERAAQDMQEALINWKQEMAEAAARQRPH